ncbi:hypothetical protein [Aurantibacter aestuarii]|uniref:Uncharacterized protein n=1 Tax=Aurantibacter aestuarii TaxID=1266046 RepID=A0A2T1N8C4_9FLAO|nr:hypothetical protein [Aurantibacter aestuarii]PSG88073.1 hypothetical protein C7H52_07145 [Aurantibacter aestuarii]
MRFFLIFIYLFFSHSNAQIELDIILPVNYSIHKNKKDVGKNNEIAVDSVVSNIDSTLYKNLKNFTFFDNKRLLKKYSFHTFGYSDNKSIQQWIVPIRVYFDPLIDKSIVSNFKRFIIPFSSIENLDISVVDDINKANYYFKVFDKEISAFTHEDLKDFSLEEKKTLTFSLMTYNLNVKSNNQIYSCIFKISSKELENPLFLSKLKKGFYLSLNRFYSSSLAENYSILNKNTEYVEEVSDYDLAMLKIHYHYIFKTPVYLNQFEILEKKYHSIK